MFVRMKDKFEYSSPESAVAGIRSGQNIFIHSVSAAPQKLINALVKQAFCPQRYNSLFI
jgi:hypothetical protein